ncbi:MAG: hypothetical protein JMDDDDMK_00968 [Acidobacteria bacterium]|nr:hypothetical protein [Acidobacteriota bacterium]
MISAIIKPFPIFKFAVVGATALLFAITAHAQKADPNDPRNAERGAEMVKQAVQARGGERFLSYTSIMSTGMFTPFDKGMSQIPVQFVDWIVYPDKERTEFGKGKKKNRRIQVNVGKTGWVYDGEAETLKDQTDKQIEEHLDGLEFDIDRILRAVSKDPGIEVKFAGREEIRPGERADVVSIKLKSEQIVYLWLDRQTHLPMSLIYEKNDNGLTKHETRYFQYIDYDGVKFPNIVDYYRDGVQSSRVNIQSVKLNAPVSDELFTKPASVKAIK